MSSPNSLRYFAMGQEVIIKILKLLFIKNNEVIFIHIWGCGMGFFSTHPDSLSTGQLELVYLGSAYFCSIPWIILMCSSLPWPFLWVQLTTLSLIHSVTNNYSQSLLVSLFLFEKHTYVVLYPQHPKNQMLILTLFSAVSHAIYPPTVNPYPERQVYISIMVLKTCFKPHLQPLVLTLLPFLCLCSNLILFWSQILDFWLCPQSYLCYYGLGIYTCSPCMWPLSSSDGHWLDLYSLLSGSYSTLGV